MKNKDKKILIYAGLFLLLFSLCAAILQKESRRIFIFDENGKLYAKVKDENEIKEAFEEAKESIKFGKIILYEDIKQMETYEFFGKTTDKMELEAMFVNKLPKYVNAWGVFKNGECIAGLMNRDDVLDMLSQFKTYYVKKITGGDERDTKILDVKFLDDIEVKHTLVRDEDILTKTEFYSKIFTATKNNKIVFKDEELGESSGLKKATDFPGVFVTNKEPFSLDIIIKDKRTERVVLPQTTILNYDETLEKGEEVVEREGVDGELLRNSENFFINGKVVKTEVLDEVVSVEPSSEIRRVGDRDEAMKPKFGWPSIGRITSGFGPRFDGFHRGLDIANYLGATVRASQRGKVVFAGFSGSYGNVVIIDHKGGYQTRYAHLLKPLVSVSQIVDKNEAIGLMGSTGNSTGSHVHFEILKNGELIDPEGEL
ncbi:MAG: peptidoglycan DD-metalloendopeptidase family protein [Ezakiella sp.]|uniref:peptidoglycan DD-metalloendopeptidase family protein n=1 Tax=Ezakiella sp. TaxID=1935205 RepID=UPI002A9187E1|nr:peptidoglycan DD-metalloendopeptidase family protein [Ezakiella sp.]MDY6080385.1 peptidoglycan DD-metalloendopeptidase family protein [Ezakiella sp.]